MQRVCTKKVAAGLFSLKKQMCKLPQKEVAAFTVKYVLNAFLYINMVLVCLYVLILCIYLLLAEKIPFITFLNSLFYF